MKREAISSLLARRNFLRRIGRAAACAGAVAAAGTLGVAQKVAAKSESSPSRGSFPTKDYDWTKHHWAFGVDATKCIGCLRCVEACKRENDVAGDAHHFRTWVERYVYLEGDKRARIDSHHDPGEHRGLRFGTRIPVRQPLPGREGGEGFLRAQAVQPMHASGLRAGVPYRRHLQGPRTAWCSSTTSIASAAGTACRPVPTARAIFNAREGVTDKCTWCYHRITKGLQPACVEVCPVGARVFGDRNDKQSPISLFIRNNRVQVLRPETGNAPNVFYVGIDKEVS